MENSKNKTQPKIDTKADVVNQFTGEKWYYSDIVKEHFFNPRNLMLEEPDESQYDAVGMVGSPACVAEDTVISLADGKALPIQNLVGSVVKVKAYDGTAVVDEVASFIRKTRENAKLLRITLNDNSLLRVTPDHLLMMEDSSYKPAESLKSGDVLISFGISSPQYISSIEPSGTGDTYDMIVNDLHNFAVVTSARREMSGVFSHNCGDMMKMWLKIEKGSERVVEMKWRTFGCGSAIAATSMFSVMVTENGGLPIADALKIKPQHIMERLGGLPNRKIHCSVLADKAFRKATNEYFRRSGQNHRVVIEGAKVIDPVLNITDKDIEEAVLEGATDLDSVQKKLKVGVGSPEIIIEVEQLIRFYKEKYYG